jgi:hypothetical protein
MLMVNGLVTACKSIEAVALKDLGSIIAESLPNKMPKRGDYGDIKVKNGRI